MKEKMINIDGINFYVKDNELAGEAIFFIHCSGGNTAQWDAVMPLFEKENNRIVMADMRGHGKSDRPDVDYKIGTMASDVKNIMDKLEIAKANLVGSSMGAEIAVCFGATYPEKTLRIVCEGAFQNAYGENGENDTPEDQVEEAIKERLEGLKNRKAEEYESMEAMLSHYEKMFEDDWNEYWKNIYISKFKQLEDGRVKQCFEPKLLLQYCEDYYSFNFEDCYKKIKSPVLFLPDSNEAKSETVMASLKKFRSHLLSSEINCIEGAEHAATMVIKPKEYAKVVMGFIKG